YAPAPNRDCLLSLARALSPDTDLALASGHVHDPAEVLAAGAPYLKRREGIGLEMRLFGPIRDRRTSRLRVRRATARLFPLGIDEVGVVTFSPDNLHFEVIRPAGAGQPPRRIRIG
ncbi:MAG TPA: hypothetical protein VMP10_00895, partial [Chloroflexota bacterium]|nr:hypothetical protein [Chloroflexota bacterium]